MDAPFIVNMAKGFITSTNPEAAFKTVSIKLYKSFHNTRSLQPFMNQIEDVQLDLELDLEKDDKENYFAHHPSGQIMQISHIVSVATTEENFWCAVPGVVSRMHQRDQRLREIVERQGILDMCRTNCGFGGSRS
uniref:Uncharacterized protein n=1 Tax=Acrobeloides nanus TaxID=290746 RepID=A0A914EP18_9BILA